MTLSFSDLALSPRIHDALREEGYTSPTPIQSAAIPHLLEGRDLLGIAQTGTGKTAAFALPILERLAASGGRPGPKGVRTLVLTPTRELAIQIGESFRAYGRHLPLRRTVVFGGVGYRPQIDALARGVDILVATPGRLLDLINQGHVRFEKLEVFVLDEADRMLDMGFIRDVRKIAALLPPQRQTLLFSATMPGDIAGLASSVLKNPVRVEATPVATPAERIEQRVMFVDAGNKRGLLAHVLKDPAVERALVFTRTKHGADKVARQIGDDADAIHGNKSQNARQRALEAFRSGEVRVLVATDIAARGIDIDGITHVINYELPNEPESYVHRIGRTARAGAEGVAIAFCAADERPYLRSIEKLTGLSLAVVADHPFPATAGASSEAPREPRGQRSRSGQRGQRQPQAQPSRWQSAPGRKSADRGRYSARY